MTDARHRWVFPDPMRLDPAFREAARAAGLGTFAATVLARRGVADEAALDAFLGPGDRRAARPAAPAGRGARRRADRPRPRGWRAGDGVRRLRRGRAHRARAARPRPPPPRDRHDPVRAVAARGGPRPVARRGRRRGRGRRRADHHRRHRLHERRRGGRRPRARHRRHRHGPPPPARGAAGGDRAREPPAGGLGLPGTHTCRGAASRSPSPGCSSASWRTRRPRRSSSRTSRRSGPSRTSRR